MLNEHFAANGHILIPKNLFERQLPDRSIFPQGFHIEIAGFAKNQHNLFFIVKMFCVKLIDI